MTFKRRQFSRISLHSLLLFLPIFLCDTLTAFARMGGGHSYSGGHSSGGGGYSGGGYSGGGYSGGSYSSGGGGEFIFDLIYLIFRLVFGHPVIGIPLVVLVIYLIYKAQNSPDLTDTVNSTFERSPQAHQYQELYQNVGTSQALQKLQEVDPNFSRAIFMDFTYSLFAQIHNARGNRQLGDYSNYFSDPVLKGLEQISPAVAAVEGIIIGSSRIYAARLIGEQAEIKLEFQANYTEISSAGASQSWFVTECWTLIRNAKVPSRTPEQAQALRCPSCGAPLSETRNGRCGSCGNRNDHGQFDWFVQYRTETREVRGPLLTSDVPEVGTDLPTLYDPHLNDELNELSTLHPDFIPAEFEARVRHTFMELQKAWTERRWELARPFESDSLFQTHLYWITAYQKQQLINVLKNIQIEKVLLVKVAQDKFYSSVTVRIYASMIDYTTKASGNEVVSGSPSRPRRFSEYWTFIRSHDVSMAGGSKKSNDQCPSCGAPLKINMAGVCEFCQTKVTSGRFDWVLSEIEQDESYAG